MKEFKNIKIGDKFNCYDDGKVRVSRQDVVTIINIIPKEKWDVYRINETIGETADEDWALGVNHEVCLIGVNSNGKEDIFLETRYGSWFSVDSWGSGLLDVNEQFTEMLIKELKRGYFDYNKEDSEHYMECLKNKEVCEEINETKAIINILKG